MDEPFYGIDLQYWYIDTFMWPVFESYKSLVVKNVSKHLLISATFIVTEYFLFIFFVV
jgi:hypothetical protein